MNTAAPAANGDIKIDLAGPRELAAWLGQQLPLPMALCDPRLAGRLDLAASVPSPG